MDGRKQLAFFFFFVFLLTYYVPFIPLLSIFMWIFTAVVFSGVLMHLFFFFLLHIRLATTSRIPIHKERSRLALLARDRLNNSCIYYHFGRR